MREKSLVDTKNESNLLRYESYADFDGIFEIPLYCLIKKCAFKKSGNKKQKFQKYTFDFSLATHLLSLLETTALGDLTGKMGKAQKIKKKKIKSPTAIYNF